MLSWNEAGRRWVMICLQNTGWTFCKLINIMLEILIHFDRLKSQNCSVGSALYDGHVAYNYDQNQP